MKKHTIPMCGYCYAGVKDNTPTKIVQNMHEKARCSICGRLCYGYMVELGEDEPEDNERRPANFKRQVP